MGNDKFRNNENVEVNADGIELDDVYIIKNEATDEDVVWVELDDEPVINLGEISPDDDLYLVEGEDSDDKVWVELETAQNDDLGEISPDDDLYLIGGEESDDDEIIVVVADGYEDVEDVETVSLTIGEYENLEMIETVAEDDIIIGADDCDDGFVFGQENGDEDNECVGYDDFDGLDME